MVDLSSISTRDLENELKKREQQARLVMKLEKLKSNILAVLDEYFENFGLGYSTEEQEDMFLGAVKECFTVYRDVPEPR